MPSHLKSSKRNYKAECTRLKKIIEGVPGCVYWKDKYGTYLGCNKVFLEMVGCETIEEIVGKRDEDFSWKDQAEALRRHDKEVMILGTQSFEETVILSDGNILTYTVVKSPLHDERGDIIGVIGTSLDISGRKKLEQELLAEREKAEEAGKVKTQFISNMEHDLRTPFNGLYGMSAYLWEKEEDPLKKELLGDITQSAKELLDYCTSILDFSKIAQNELKILHKKFNLFDLMNKIISIEKPAAKHKNLKLILSYDKKAPTILIGDDYRLMRVLMNLTSNAIKFTGVGTIKVLVKLAKVINEKTVIIQFIVSDTGVGISHDKMRFIYEKFSRGTESNKGMYKGLGLGLSIVKQFIEEMLGEIEVISEPNQGTQVICTIPFTLPLLGDEKNFE